MFFCWSMRTTVTDLRCWPCTSTWLRRRRPHGTGRCSAVADDCSRTPGCARRPLTLCWSPESSCDPQSPPGRSLDRHLPRPGWWKWTTGGLAASGWHCKVGILAPGPPEKKKGQRSQINTHATILVTWGSISIHFLLLVVLVPVCIQQFLATLTEFKFEPQSNK